MSVEFKAYPKISRLGKSRMTITQKIHGTNAQVHIFENEDGEMDLRVGSRTRWIFPERDNYGFAAFVEQHRAEFIEKLGPGTHFGEWAGPGINSGEGLTEKTFILFDWFRYPEDRPLPPQTRVVPVLYDGALDVTIIESVMAELKEKGSVLAPGFMRPEGVVISFAGTKYKRVFDPEETEWTKGTKNKNKVPKVKQDFSHLCQPIRLQKLLSRDEEYIREYPKSLGTIVKDYVTDLVEEDQIVGDEDQIKAIKKGASGQIFKFVRDYIDLEL